MNMDSTAIFSAKKVCDALLGDGLISDESARAFLQKSEQLIRKLEARRVRSPSSVPPGLRTYHPPTAVDALVALELRRTDGIAGVLDEEIIFQCLAGGWQIPYKKIDPLKLDLNLVTTTIPRSFAMKHLLLPIEVSDDTLTVATPNPFNMEALEDITRVCSYKIRPVVSPKTDIIKLIDEFFGFKRSIAAAETMFAGPTVDLGNLEQYVRLQTGDELNASDQHIVNAVNHLFSYSFDQRASDIHIEPKREVALVRMRIDGVLHTVYRLPRKVHNAIISRIKTLARMDMAEKRRPQDGRIKTDKGDVEVEIRISTVPVAFGEKVVMRIMDPDVLFQDLSGLGFTEQDLVRYRKFVTMPHGIVMVCGPTGSGKSTTLYSTLREISTPENNVVTVEDPIEMIHEDFNQISVNPAIDITFGNILRTILRQDPDVIMIGEMRDLETARNAVQASLTGHLVLSTLHTNNAPSTITRIIEIGVPAYLIQATLVGVLAQRLVRKICPYCMETYTIEKNKLLSMGIDVGGKGKSVKLRRGKGCNKCRNTGYLGRDGIFEVMPYSDALKNLTRVETNSEEMQFVARREGMVTLRESAIQKMLKGRTTYQEVLRVTWEGS